jgi:putative ABC transport system permease protein
VRDWGAFVRARMSLDQLTPEREGRIVRELASQLEDFYRDALARGASEDVADAYARAQVRDWGRMTADLLRADGPHARPSLERLTNRIEDLAQPAPSGVEGPRRGALQMLAHLLTDMRFGIRQLLKTPGFTVVAILTLAFGVGATTAIFSVVNGVLLRPLPYPEPERLVQVLEIVPQYGRFAVAPANFLDWRQQNTVFERISAYAGGNDTYIGPEGPERVPMTSVSHDIFELLHVSPILGRSFRAEEDAPQQDNVIVISHGMWQRRFGGDPAVLGRSISLSGAPVTIVGVMPAGFFYPNRQTEFWRPIAFNPATASRGGHYIGVIARMKDGVSLEQARAEMKTIAERLAVQYPKNSANESAETVLLHDQIVGPIRPMLLTLLAAVAVVVLIACANVANLLLVRASVREKEIAIRIAIGAGRARIAMQMLGESLVLALAGGLLGVGLAYLAITPLQTLSAGSIPRVADVTIDRNVLAFSLGVSLLTGLLFGLAPAWQAARGGVGAVLKEGGRSSTGGGGRWLRSTLLVVEVALSLVLLVGATLLLRSFANVMNIDPGFRAENVLAFQVGLPRASYPEEHQQIAFFDRLIERLRSTPGVEKAGLIQTLPMRGGYVLSFAVQGRAPAQPGEELSANHRVVTPDYFQALGIPLRRGRSFSDRDTEKAPMVAVVDEAFVRRHFPGEDPIGRGIDIGNGTDGFYEIVGVVGDVHHGGLDRTPNPTMYVPYRQDVFSSMWVMVRTQGEPAQMAGAARLAVREVDPSLPAASMTPLTDVISESVAQRRFSMLLLGLFALVALFLAAVGLYGVVAYTVSLRTQEIGLRMAIGAQPGDVLRMVLGSGMKLATAGVVIGIAGALAMASLVASMLFGVTPFDPVSYAATAAVLLLVAALACYVPARRAMAVDPLVALRQD